MMDQEELIQNYIAGRLSGNERARVAEMLQTDTELQELYAVHHEMETAFRLSKSNDLKKRLQTIDAAETKDVSQKRSHNNLSRMAIAAVVIIGVTLMLTFMQSNNDLYETYFETCPNTYLPVTRGTAEETLQTEAFRAYENDDFETSEAIFREVLTTTYEPNIQFYYGMSLLNQEKFDDALQQLQSLTEKTFDYQIETLWYTALIHVKKKEFSAARIYLNTLQKSYPNYKTEDVSAILEEI